MDQRDLRLTDAEREAAVGRLSEHYAVGRLDKDEFDERSDAVWSAKTRGQLSPIFADLPRAEPERRSARRRRRRLGYPIPFLPVLAVVVAVAVITHLPFLLFGLLAWFLLAHGCRSGHSSIGHNAGHNRGSWRRESGSWA